MQPRSLTYSLPGAANFVTQIYLQYLRRFTCLAKARNKMQKIVKENQNPIETLPWWCIEYEWREDKGCPRSHLSRPETSTWNLSFLYLPDIPQLFVCRHMHNSVLTKRCKPIYISQKSPCVEIHNECSNSRIERQNTYWVYYCRLSVLSHDLTLTNWRSVHDLFYLWLISFTCCDACDKFQVWSEQLS